MTAGDVRGGLEDAQAQIRSVPSRGYVASPTPIEPLPRLSSALGGSCDIFVKRDDTLPLLGGGNKTRKLDYLMADALDAGVDGSRSASGAWSGRATAVVTSGAVQSNHARLTAAAAALEGLECHVILEERVPGSYNADASGNNYLFKLLGARTHTAPAGEVPAVQAAVVADLERRGERAYEIVGGGSDSLGALGYARAACEIIEQAPAALGSRAGGDLGLGAAGAAPAAFDAIVACSGSGGTHAGLLAGLRAAGDTTPVIGVSVRYDAATQAERIHALYEACAARHFSGFAAFEGGTPRSDVVVRDEYVGPGYSLPTEGMAEALELFARTESIMLDPVYTAKAAAGLVSMVRSGELAELSGAAACPARVLFLHTGGAPALFHYMTLYDHGGGSD